MCKECNFVKSLIEMIYQHSDKGKVGFFVELILFCFPSNRNVDQRPIPDGSIDDECARPDHW